MNSKEIGKTAAVFLFAAAEAVTPKSAIAQHKELEAVDPATLKRVTDCILTERPGNTIIKTEDHQEGQREITIIDNDQTEYLGALTRTYPGSFPLKVSKELTIPIQPYMVIAERAKGAKLPNIYVEGNPEVIIVERTGLENPEEMKKVEDYMKIRAGREINGIVDDAMFPEDEKTIRNIIEEYGEETPTSGIKLIERFKTKFTPDLSNPNFLKM